MIANVKLEGTINRIVTLGGHRFEAFDESFRFTSGPNCDSYVVDHDPVLNAALEALCELVDVDDSKDVSYDVDLATNQISNLKVELVDLD
jgi:hypothetical protein